MTLTHLSLDHLGVAVRDLEESIRLYSSMFGLKVENREILKEQEVELCFLALPNTLIELISPLPGSSGPLARFLEKQGEGLHHLCFRVDDIEAEMKRLETMGYELIDKEPRKGAYNSLIAFIHPRKTGKVLIELCQR